MNFSNTLIRASSLGNIMTEPSTKSAREAGELSETAKKNLVEIYIAEKYSRYKEVQTKQMQKGIEVENESIEMLSVYLNKNYKKNEERFTNEFVSGSPDIITEDSIIDIKSSYDLFSFLNNLSAKSLNSDYYWQLQAYMWLTNKRNGIVAYCLANTPEHIVQKEKYYLLNSMNVVSEESPEYIKESAKLEFNLTFDDIDLRDKILLFNVERNDDDIEKIKDKVEQSRNYLNLIEEKHLNFNKNVK